MAQASDRLQEHAAVAEPVAEAAPQAPGALGAGPLSPARIMAMQRSAGNAAVTAMLSRMTATDLPELGDGELATRLQPRPVRAAGAAAAGAREGGAAQRGGAA